MRIAIDVRSLMEGRHSGVEEYTTHIIRSLLQIAPQHQFILFYNSARAVQLPVFVQPVASIGLRYPNKLFKAAQWASSWPRWDTLISADCFFVPSLSLMPLATQTPLVTTVHDLSFERFPEFFSFRRRLWHTLMRPRALLHKSHHLIAVSKSTATDIEKLYDIPAEKISVVHSGISLPAKRPSQSEVLEVSRKYKLPTSYILYFGTLEPRKNIPSLIRAFTAVAPHIPHDLVIAGQAGWLLKGVMQAVAASPVKHRIHITGFIAQEDKAALYAGATVFVYPSFYEGFGFPPLEALVSGTPVITSFNSSLPEVVGEWATLVDPYSPAELALVLREMVEQPRSVPLATSAAIKQRYDWDESARRTLQVIEKVTSSQYG